MTELRAIRAQTFTIRVECSGTTRKMFKIGYLKSDGSIWVAFPYFEHSHGLVSVIWLPPGEFDQNADLRPGGKVTSHLVKYSHHRSGLALFSHSGKVLPAVRKKSVPLATVEGHLFTVQLKGLDGFAEDEAGKPDQWTSKDLQTRTEQTVTFNAGSSESVSLKFVLRCYNKKRLRERVFGEAVGPVTTMRPISGGEPGQGVLLAAPRYRPGSTTYLAILAKVIPSLTDMPGSHLTFIGGFDPPEVAMDPSKPTSFLALSYPADDYDELRQTIGSIDLDEELQRQQRGQ